tara:strand:+ start:669 stop:1133 length:465 start_codon:yes stop_codon:yes gene_type:complete
MLSWVAAFKANNTTSMEVITNQYGAIGDWNTSEVEDMSILFQNAGNFNEDISGWDTSSVTNMYHMFEFAIAFNSDISQWDTSSVTNMEYMFANAPGATASAFDQNISSWDVGNVNRYGPQPHMIRWAGFDYGPTTSTWGVAEKPRFGGVTYSFN